MKTKPIFLGLFTAFFLFSVAQAQNLLNQGKWHAELKREDGHHIPFELDIQKENGKYIAHIINGSERIKTAYIDFSQDSVIIRMPVFESYFKAKIITSDSLNGLWVNGSADKDIIMPFIALRGGSRFSKKKISRTENVQGTWGIEFTRSNQTKRRAIGELAQNGSHLSGSVLTPAADYRYLDGVVAGDSLFLSTFDGSHALLLSAKIRNGEIDGHFYSSNYASESWTAVKDANLTLTPAVTEIKEGNNGRLDFSFKDLDEHTVSIKDERFKDKVVIVQIMGSWCPNCMDETAFLSEYYRKNKHRGIEIIALAYELSANEERSVKSLKKFQSQFDVQYPMLNTGVAVGDPQRTEKTLPQLTAIQVFPTTIILDKKGVVSAIETSFYGPGAGEHHQRFKEHFENSVDTLLDQPL